MYSAHQITVNTPCWDYNIFESSKLVKVVGFKDLALMYHLEDYLNEVDLPLRAEREATFVLSTSSMSEIFYYAMVSVIKQKGVDFKDKFFDKHTYIPLEKLKQRTVKGQREQLTKLDSLYYLVMFAYRRCLSAFKAEVDSLQTNQECFYYFRSIFEATYQMIIVGRGDQLKGSLHAKALLTTLMKSDFPKKVKRCLYN